MSRLCYRTVNIHGLITNWIVIMRVLKTEGLPSVISVRTEIYLPRHCHSRLLLAGIHLWFPFRWIPADYLRGWQKRMVMPDIVHRESRLPFLSDGYPYSWSIRSLSKASYMHRFLLSYPQREILCLNSQGEFWYIPQNPMNPGDVKSRLPLTTNSGLRVES